MSVEKREREREKKKNDVIIWYDFGDKNSLFGGQKLSYRFENCVQW